jgi:large subunit ribosomal protein L7/L12
MAEGNGRSWSPDVKALGDKIVALAKPQAAELSDYLAEVYKIKGGKGGAAPMPGPENVTDVVTPPPPTDFHVVLDGVADPAKKINVIKLVREITTLGLKEAKDLVEGAPKTVKENMPKAEAEALKKKLEEGGAKISLKPAP